MIAINMPDAPREIPLRKEIVRCLCHRILKFLRDHPEIMETPLTQSIAFSLSPFFRILLHSLFLDLDPTLAEVTRAFYIAEKVHKDLEKPD